MDRAILVRLSSVFSGNRSNQSGLPEPDGGGFIRPVGKKNPGDKSAKKCRVFCCQMELITCMLREEDGTMQQVDTDVTPSPLFLFHFLLVLITF